MASGGGDMSPTLPPGSPASPGASQAITDLLTCPVCLEPYREPKTLACLHSFCSCCLENCRRSFRREISCPVCKKVTPLSPYGVSGLQNDFRIQQIRDILQQGQASPPPQPSTTSDAGDVSPTEKLCDICRSQQKRTVAMQHCVQCSMFFCGDCHMRHENNLLFESHHVIDLRSQLEAETLYCKIHREHSVRYFCKPCGVMMCTICTMTHDSDHNPVSLDKSVIAKYQQNLQENLHSIKSKLSEVKTRTKYIETVRQTYQKALYDTQNSIKQKTEEFIRHIRKQEHQLLQDVAQRMEAKMRNLGLDNLGEMNFHKANIENLYMDVEKVIRGSPQHCLVAYDDLICRMKSVAETSLPMVERPKIDSILKFVPAEECIDVVLGQLQEINVSDDLPSDPDAPTDINVSYADVSPRSPTTPHKTITNRRTSILNALSPTRKGEIKIGKVKAFSNHVDKVKSPNGLNADDIIGSTSDIEIDNPQPSTSTAATITASAPSPATKPKNLQYLAKPTLVFKIDQVGGWPGKIMNPSGVHFLPDGSIVVAEGDNRLQIFDQSGQSLRIIGWGKIKPQGVTVMRGTRIAITDKREKCVKVFSIEGDMRKSWGTGVFGMPAGIASMSSGNYVITDVDKHAISIHTADGSLLTQFGTWGSGDYQFNSPAYVTVNNDEEIFISDSCNGCIKVFNQTGKFLRKFSLAAGVSGSLRRPQGICIDPLGNLLVADRDNHRISVYKPDGTFVRHLLDKHDGIRYPCDVKAGMDGNVVVVETHSGFLSKEPHHAIKMYTVSQSS